MKVLFLGGVAVLNAVACCAWPAVLGFLGLGTSGIGVFVMKYQPVFLASSFLFLGLAHYGVYGQKVCEGCKRPRLPQVLVWGATAGTLYFALPQIV